MDLESLTKFLESEAWKNLWPVITFFLGFVSSVIIEFVKDRIAVRREHRNQDRAFQRESLLHIQEEVAGLMDRALERFLEHGELTRPAANVASYRIAMSRTRLAVYAVRVSDESFQKLIKSFYDALTSLGGTFLKLGAMSDEERRRRQDISVEYSQFMTAWNKANSRIGELLKGVE